MNTMTSESLREALETEIKGNPLFVENISLAKVDPALTDPDRGDMSMYFGTGLSTTKSMSQGFPFDLLGMVCTAVLLQRQLGLKQIIHEISDLHAKTNGFCDKGAVDRLAARQKRMMVEMARRLGIEDVYIPVLASEYQNQGTYLEILRRVQADDALSQEPLYAQRQWAGMEWLQRYQKVGLKLSWLISERDPAKFDERFFDENYPQPSDLTPLSYIYTPTGRTFDPAQGRKCPYSSAPGEKRLMLDGRDPRPFLEPFMGEGQPKAIRKPLAHYQAIVDVFEQVFGEVDGATLPEKINSIFLRVMDCEPIRNPRTSAYSSKSFFGPVVPVALASIQSQR